MKVEDVVERVYRRYLSPAFDQPVSSLLTSDIAAAATSLTIDPFSSIEYADAVTQGTILEIGYELMRVTAVTGEPVNADSTMTVSVARGVMGTTAVDHATGDNVVVSPPFNRHDVWLAVLDEIEALYPDLSLERHMLLTGGDRYLPDDFAELTDCTLVNAAGLRWPAYGAYVEWDDDEAVLVVGHDTAGWDVRISYMAMPKRPTKDSETLASLNVADRWADIVALGAAAQMVEGHNVSDLNADYLTEVSEIAVTEQVDPQSISQSLRRARAIAVINDRRRHLARRRVRVHKKSPFGLG